MDTLTHGLAGALLARSLPSTGNEDLDRTLARREAWVGFLAAMLPDADVFVSPFSAEFYITQHRALTHSFVMLPVWIVALTALAALRLSPGLGPPGAAARRAAVWRLGAVVALGLVSHILLDWITSWGTMLLSPLSWTRYMLDWTFIVDLALSGLLALGLVGVRVVSRGSFPRSRNAARAGLLAAAAYVGLCAVRHGEALRLAGPLGTESARRAAIPQPGSPDRWLLLSDDGPAVTAALADIHERGRHGRPVIRKEEPAVRRSRLGNGGSTRGLGPEGPRKAESFTMTDRTQPHIRRRREEARARRVSGARERTPRDDADTDEAEREETRQRQIDDERPVEHVPGPRQR